MYLKQREKTKVSHVNAEWQCKPDTISFEKGYVSSCPRIKYHVAFGNFEFDAILLVVLGLNQLMNHLKVNLNSNVKRLIECNRKVN